MGDVPVEVAGGPGAEHPDGPIWDAATGRLWWVDITGQAVHCCDPRPGDDRVWRLPWQSGGVVIDTLGGSLLSAPEGLTLLDPGTGRTSLRVAVEQDKPENRANDVKADSHGRCWLGTMAFDKPAANAALYRVASGHATRVVDGLTISNGPALDEVRARTYRADTAVFRVDLVDLDPTTDAVSGRRRFVDLLDEGFWPDGMTIDDEDTLWVACWRAWWPCTATGRTASSTGSSGVRRATRRRCVRWPRPGHCYITTSWFDLPPGKRARASCWPRRSSALDPLSRDPRARCADPHEKGSS